MIDLNEQVQNILYRHSTGEWEDSHVYDAIQDILSLNGGKLYKYRRFDPNGHSLESLRNQVVFCSEPSKFNDPFDCRVGIDIKNLIKIQFAYLEPMLDNAIKELMNDPELSHLIEQYKNQKLSDAQFSQLLQRYISSIKEIISQLIELALGQAGYDQNEMPMDAFIKIFDMLDPNQLVNNDGEIDVNAMIRQAYEIEDDVDEISLLKKMSQMHQPEKTSELETMDKQFYEIDLNLRDLIDQNFYVGCLSEKPDSVLMWSHYAESHTGFCVEYDFNRVNLSELQLLILPVLYSEERPPFPWGIASEKNRFKYEFIRSLLAKDAAWSYEKEWRILRAKPQQSEKLLLPNVSGVYLGVNCSEENKDKILAIMDPMKIPVHQMVVDRGMYKLHALTLR